MCGLGAVVVAAGMVTACGSSPSTVQASGQRHATVCQEVGATLADGPDPDADPVGYALAQIVPLRQIKATSDAPLQEAIDNLSSAYQQFYKEKGAGKTAGDAVSTATKKINALCPGVAS